MLKGEIYNPVSLVKGEGCGEAVVSLLPDSRIYKAHFPGFPITPGVCIVQICTEILSEVIGRKLEMVEAKDVRFLAPISPEQTETLSISYNYSEDLSATFVVKDCETLHSKMKLVFA